MMSRDDVEVGGGAPLYCASCTTLGDIEPSGSLSLCKSEGAASRGVELEERIRRAITRGKGKGIRQLARMVEECDNLASRSPLLQDYVAFLAHKGEKGAIRRILGKRRRGRRLVSHGLLVGAVAWVMEHEHCNQLKAAHRVRELYPEQLGHKAASSIRNDFVRYREHYELQKKGYFVPSERLTPRRWIERTER